MSRILAPLILIAALLAGWELACKALAVPAYLLPPPSAIWEAFVASWPLLLGSAWATLSTALLALIIASLIACGLALLVSLNGFLEDAVRPIAVTLQVTPWSPSRPWSRSGPGSTIPSAPSSAWRPSWPSSRSSPALSAA